MPDLTDQGLDVSAEEQRFLRKSFLRFALPYFVSFGLALVAVATMSGGDAPEPETLGALQREVAALSESVEGLASRVEVVTADLGSAVKRVRTLEGSAERTSPAGDLAVLKGDLRSASRRIAKLEKRIEEEAALERIESLSQRIASIEGRPSGNARLLAPEADDPAPASPPASPSPGPARRAPSAERPVP